MGAADEKIGIFLEYPGSVVTGTWAGFVGLATALML